MTNLISREDPDINEILFCCKDKFLRGNLMCNEAFRERERIKERNRWQ